MKLESSDKVCSEEVTQPRRRWGHLEAVRAHSESGLMGPCWGEPGCLGRAPLTHSSYGGKGVLAKGPHLNIPPSSADVASPAASQEFAPGDQLSVCIPTNVWSGGESSRSCRKFQRGFR